MTFGDHFLRYFLNIVHSLFPGDDNLWKLTHTVEDNSVFFSVHFTRRTRRPAALAHEAYWLWNRFRTKYLGNTYKYIYNTNNKKPYIIINISYKFWQDYIFGRVSDSHRQSFCKENMVAGEWGTVNLVRVQTSNAST